MERLANRPVASMPWPSLSALFARSTRSLPYPFEAPQTTLWTSARIALWEAIQVLDLRAGQRVALPAFCCGSELEPFLKAGLELSFFAVGDDLSPEPNSFREAIENASAAMATHYFGLPADLSAARDMAWQRKIPLIEDCAHALYATEGATQIGLSGDAAIFSFWKTVPLPDGGALHLRAGAVRAKPKSPPPELIRHATRHLLSRSMRSHSVGAVRALEDVRQRLRRKKTSTASGTAEPENWHLIKFPDELIRAGMASSSQRIFRGTDHAFVRESRRRHFRELEAAFAGIRGFTPMSSLGEGACPLYFPVLVDDAAGLRKALAAEAVGVKHIWPYFHSSVPWSRFPRERHWKENAIGFPVHQSLSDGDVARLIDVVKRWSRS